MSNASTNVLNDFTENIQFLPLWEPLFKAAFFLLFNLIVYPFSVKTIKTIQDVKCCFSEIKKNFKTIFNLYSVQSSLSDHIYPLEVTEMVMDYVPNMEQQAIQQISAEIEYLTTCVLFKYPQTGKVPPLNHYSSINRYQVSCPSSKYLSNITKQTKNRANNLANNLANNRANNRARHNNFSLSIYVEPQELNNNHSNETQKQDGANTTTNNNNNNNDNKNDNKKNDNNVNDNKNGNNVNDNKKNDNKNNNNNNDNDYNNGFDNNYTKDIKSVGDQNVVNNNFTIEWCRYILFLSSRSNYLFGFHLFALCCTAITILFTLINDSLCNKYSLLTVYYRLFLRINNSQIAIHLCFCLIYGRKKIMFRFYKNVVKKIGSSICLISKILFYLGYIPLNIVVVVHTLFALWIFLPITLFGYLGYWVVAHILFIIIFMSLSVKALLWSKQAQDNLMHNFFSEFYLIMGLTICGWANSILILFLKLPEKDWVNAIVYDFQQRNLFEFFFTDYRTLFLF